MQPVNQERLFDIIQNVVQERECEIYDWQLHAQSRKKILRIYVYHSEGVSIGLCRQISKAIARILEEDDMIPGAYVLEVSSPGLERSLKEPRHFQQAVSEQASVTLKNGAVLKGVIQKCADEGFELQIPEETITLTFAEVASAKTVFEFGKAKK